MMGSPGLKYPLSVHSNEKQRIFEEEENNKYRMAIYIKRRVKYELTKQSRRDRVS